MKIYIATPVNGRKEKTMQQKSEAAYKRILEMREYITKYFRDADFYYSFLLRQAFDFMSEAEIMGSCVSMVMECDMIVLDDGWESSRGCTIERYVAMQYGKQIRTINWFKLQEVLTKIMDKAKEL